MSTASGEEKAIVLIVHRICNAGGSHRRVTPDRPGQSKALLCEHRSKRLSSLRPFAIWLNGNYISRRRGYSRCICSSSSLSNSARVLRRYRTSPTTKMGVAPLKMIAGKATLRAGSQYSQVRQNTISTK